MVLIYPGGALRAPRNPGLRPGFRNFSVGVLCHPLFSVSFFSIEMGQPIDTCNVAFSLIT